MNADAITTDTVLQHDLQGCASNGLVIERKYFTPDGQPADPANVKQNTRLVAVLSVMKPAGDPDNGNYLLVDDGPWSAVRWLLDEAWAVEVDPVLRSERLLARHVEFGKPAERAAAWVESVDVPNAAFVRSTFDRADLVVRAT